MKLLNMPYKKDIFRLLTGYIRDLTMNGAYMKLSTLSVRVILMVFFSVAYVSAGPMMGNDAEQLFSS